MIPFRKITPKFAFAAMTLIGSAALAQQPQQSPSCPMKAAEATVTCVGAIRGIMSPSPVDKALGIVAAPACLQQTYEAAKCYQQQGSRPPGR